MRRTTRSLFVILAGCVLTQPLAARQSAPAAPAAPAQAPAVDRALVAQFLAADTAGRIALIAAHPDIVEKRFRDWLISEGGRLRTANDPSEADRYFQAALYIGRQHRAPDTAVQALNGLAQIASNAGNGTEARQLLEEALALATAAGSLTVQQQTLANLAIVQRVAGDLDDALANQQRALELAQQLDIPLSVARALHNLGIVLFTKGENARALDYYFESLALKKQINAPANDMQVTLTSIGAVYADQGDYEPAIGYYQRAIDVMGNVPVPGMAPTYNNLGQIQMTTGDIEAAKQNLDRALLLARQAGNASAEATATYNLGILARRQNRLEDSEALQLKALVSRERLGAPVGLAESLTELSNLMVHLGRGAESLSYGQRAISIASDSRLLSQLWKAELTVANAYVLLNDIVEARRLYERAAQRIETLRSLAMGSGSGDGQAMMSERLGPYYGLAALEAGAGRPFEALAAIDRGRARVLVDVIATRQASAQQLSAEQRDEELRVTAALQRASAKLAAEIRKSKPDRATLEALDIEVGSARAKRDAVLARINAAQPAVRLARGVTPDLTRAGLEQALTRGTAIVSFMLDTGTSWAYVSTSSANGPVVTAHALPADTESILQLVDRFSRQISTRDLGFGPTARAAYDALIAPFEQRLTGISRVIIIPDGPLWGLPFQALQTPRRTFLLEERAISYAPSISALVSLEERRRTRAASSPFLVAFGDPAIAAQPSTSESSKASLRGGATTRLPEAAREVRAIGRLYGSQRSHVLTDNAATEQALRTKASQATVLHVATHGILDDKSPMYSHLLLAPGPGRPTDDDGRLNAWEVMDIGMSVDIAVLSACQTSRGGSGFGEGVMGLSWSLFAAGASTAVVSQWEVDSASTTSLMIAFHQQLLSSGLRVDASADALRQAALTVLRKPAYRHPFYWAGFISIGAR